MWKPEDTYIFFLPCMVQQTQTTILPLGYYRITDLDCWQGSPELPQGAGISRSTARCPDSCGQPVPELHHPHKKEVLRITTASQLFFRWTVLKVLCCICQEISDNTTGQFSVLTSSHKKSQLPDFFSVTQGTPKYISRENKKAFMMHSRRIC